MISCSSIGYDHGVTGQEKARQQGANSRQKWIASAPTDRTRTTDRQTTHQRPPTGGSRTNGKTRQKNRQRAAEVLERESSGIETRLEVLASGTYPELDLQCDPFNVETFTVIGSSAHVTKKLEGAICIIFDSPSNLQLICDQF